MSRAPEGIARMALAMRPRLLLAFVAAGAALVGAPARADIRCSIENVTPVSFSTYDVFRTSPLDAQGSVTYTCRGVGQRTVSIDLSSGSSGQFSSRSMTSTEGALPYNLFLDSACTTIWGDGGGGSSRYGPLSPPNNSSIVVPIYGRIPPEQNVAPGSYADSVTLTLNF